MRLVAFILVACVATVSAGLLLGASGEQIVDRCGGTVIGILLCRFAFEPKP